MKTIILYDTKFGNTEEIAKAIGGGMREAGYQEVEVKCGSETRPDELREAEIWIFGSPTHMGGTTRNFKKLMRWMKKQGPQSKRGMAFDTRMEDAKKGAADKIAQAMLSVEVEMLCDPPSFIVQDREGPLSQGELERATAIGRKLAAQIRV